MAAPPVSVQPVNPSVTATLYVVVPGSVATGFWTFALLSDAAGIHTNCRLAPPVTVAFNCTWSPMHTWLSLAVTTRLLMLPTVMVTLSFAVQPSGVEALTVYVEVLAGVATGEAMVVLFKVPLLGTQLKLWLLPALGTAFNCSD